MDFEVTIGLALISHDLSEWNAQASAIILKGRIMKLDLADRVLKAIESHHLESESIPVDSAANPLAQDLFAILLRIGDEEIGRVGVWKIAPGGPIGEGAARVHANGSHVHITAGEGMPGSFSIDCEFAADAEEIAHALRERLDTEYQNLEIPLAGESSSR